MSHVNILIHSRQTNDNVDMYIATYEHIYMLKSFIHKWKLTKTIERKWEGKNISLWMDGAFKATNKKQLLELF